MIEKVFLVEGHQVKSLLLGDKSLMFSSKSCDSAQQFNEYWNKKISLGNKIEIDYDSIISVAKEDLDDTIKVKLKSKLKFLSGSEFSFIHNTDNEIFFTFLEKELHFIRTYEKLSPIKAIASYIFGLIFTVGITIFAHYQSIEISNGTIEETYDAKVRLFYLLIEKVGDIGVWIIGSLITCFFLYKIWTRYTNPPYQIKLFSPYY